MPVQKKDELMDHDADGIQEYDNDLPRWWLYGFYFTIFCSVIYIYYYHMYTGKDWNVLWYGARGQVAEYEHSVKEAKITLASVGGASSGASLKYVLKTDAAALKRGEEIFNGSSNLCFTCHRQDLGGIVGPNLTDEYWIHGGTYKSVIKSIKSGYPDKGMMPYGSNAKLSDEDLMSLASYIVSKQGSNPASPKPVDPAREKKLTEAGTAAAEAAEAAEAATPSTTEAAAATNEAATESSQPVATSRSGEQKRQIDPRYAGWPLVHTENIRY
jgi:cytochrome c oxidase cbb3-type subunit 3